MVYSDTDIQIIHHPYFSLIRLTDSECELRSNNSGHYWKIVLKADYCDLEHKHVKEKPYHHQTSFGSVELSLLEIVNHDDYSCKRRKLRNDYSEFFEYIVEFYKKNA